MLEIEAWSSLKQPESATMATAEHSLPRLLHMSGLSSKLLAVCDLLDMPLHAVWYE